ncbi:hypothetical protein [Streptomyces sp. AP-93]|uniref:hypothetical protein n=1 Tax=Streptomyces sp. AP-93 TaxID=2929048 RepID=UPI001FAF0CDB|nr:hypothetical protein [Streptomyces sp. AP-93]MCJ0868685.1 hypothetical protein [Streptomyces sp. AP-93]
MIERFYRKLISRLPVPPDISIPIHLTAQTAIASTLSVVVRWSSALTFATVTGVVWFGAPPEALWMCAPAVWADRTSVTYQRIRRT